MTQPSFADLFGRFAEHRGEAPGRVNLIGEHTDYNGGYVLPIAIPQRTQVELAIRSDRRVRVWSTQFPHAAIEYELGLESRDRDWGDYVRAMTWALAPLGLASGVDLRIDSSVPPGSGLSSSAALEIALGRALRAGFALPVDDISLAKLARTAENDFVGAPVGIMDQMACTLADATSALFLDTRSLEYVRLPMPRRAALAVIDSGVSHRHASGEYAVRRSQCAEAARRLGVAELRDITDCERAADLPGPLDRRARHVITENQRVLETVEALAAGDLARIGELFCASHDSLRNDFEVSVPALDSLVEIARGVPGVYGARLTGGGFGGSVVVICAAENVHQAAAEIVSEYRRITRNSGRALVPVRC
jgi:galactokinase